MIGDPNTKHPGAGQSGLGRQRITSTSTPKKRNRLAGNVMSYNIQELGMSIVDVVAANNQSVRSLVQRCPGRPRRRRPTGAWRRRNTDPTRWRSPPSAATGSRCARASRPFQSDIRGSGVCRSFRTRRGARWKAQVALRYTEIEGRGIYGQPGTAKFHHHDSEAGHPLRADGLPGAARQHHPGLRDAGPVRIVRRCGDHQTWSRCGTTSATTCRTFATASTPPTATAGAAPSKSG